jgi:outer membrane immunogenic protein
MIKQLVAATVAIGTLTFSAANAADLSVPLKTPLPPPVWTWTGCYVGIEGGGALGTDPVVASTGPFTGRTVTTITPTNGLVGGTVGCNYQFTWFVIGVEDDLSFNGIQSTAVDLAPFPTTNTHSVRGTWLDTLRGRVGIATWDNTFVYATGGAAFAGLRDSVAGPGGVVGASVTNNVTGWTAGGGVEWMPFQNWSVKVEYLRIQFPTVSDAFNTATPPFVGVTTRLSENVIRAGVNWHFNWWAPVARGF